MAHKKSYSGMSGGEPLSSLRDVHVPSNAVPGAALSLTPTGEFTILEYSQDYFTARALEFIPPMGAVKLGPGGVLPRTSSEEPSSPVIGVSVAGAGAGEDVVVLRSGKIAGKVFAPENSILRTLVDGTVGVAAAGTIVGTVDEAGVGYVSIGSASSGEGGGSASVSAEPGNIISEKPDGLYAGGSAGGTYDLVDGTVVKLPFKLNGKQVYAFKIVPFIGPGASSLINLPSAIPAFDNAWIDMQSSYYERKVHSTTLHDTMSLCGPTWYVGVQIPERRLHTSGNLSNASLHITLLFTRADGQ